MEKIVLEDKERETLYKKLEQIFSLNDLYLKEYEEEGKLFKSKKYRIESVKKEDIKEYIKSYLVKIGELMEIEIHTEFCEDGDVLNVGIVTNNSSILIGKEGKNVDALQNLLRQSLRNQVGFPIKMNLDVSNYKLKKQKRLEREIKNIAREIIRTKIDVKLDPMNAFDRRVVHSVISEYPHLKTQSVGETPNRYVIIQYEEN